MVQLISNLEHLRKLKQLTFLTLAFFDERSQPGQRLLEFEILYSAQSSKMIKERKFLLLNHKRHRKLKILVENKKDICKNKLSQRH